MENIGKTWLFVVPCNYQMFVMVTLKSSDQKSILRRLEIMPASHVKPAISKIIWISTWCYLKKKIE